MLRQVFFIFFLIALSFAFIYGKTDNINQKSPSQQNETMDNDVKIYLIKKCHSQKELTMAIDESSVILEDKPLIEYKDIVSYDSANHTFFLTAAKKQELMKKMNTKDELALKAFALVVDKEIIYTGYFWHPYSSLSCDWFTIDSFKLGHKGIISIELGSYTGIKPDIKDRRNDKRLLKVLEKNGKIK
jgi:hypothetical protein